MAKQKLITFTQAQYMEKTLHISIYTCAAELLIQLRVHKSSCPSTSL